VSSTVVVNFLTIVHKKSNGMVMGFPDACKTPTPGGPVPIPYPNVAMSKDLDKGTKKVKVDGQPAAVKGSVFSTSTGDEAGTAGGGVVSSTTKGKAEFMMYSFDVKLEGKAACRLSDIMVLNKNSAPNTPPFPCVQPPAVVPPGMADDAKSKPGLWDVYSDD
jgi:uncharacterized Zn-binding protein involved in type VI secretion